MRFLSYFILFTFFLTSQVSAVNIGSQVPAITLPELSSGAAKQLDNFKGKVVLLDFWGSWCIPCKSSFPVYEKFFKDYGSKGFEVVAVNEDENKSAAQDFLATYPASFTILHDINKEAAKAFSPPQMPTSFLVDRTGKIVKVYPGFRESDVPIMKSDIEHLLGQ